MLIELNSEILEVMLHTQSIKQLLKCRYIGTGRHNVMHATIALQGDSEKNLAP